METINEYSKIGRHMINLQSHLHFYAVVINDKNKIIQNEIKKIASSVIAQKINKLA